MCNCGRCNNTCSSDFCQSVQTCIGINPNNGSSTLVLNQQGQFIPVSNSGFICTQLANCSTDNLPQGTTNLYFKGVATDGITIIGNGTLSNPLVSSQDLITTKIHITSSQILNSFVSPIQLLPAPGSGKFIAVINCSLILNYNSSPYSSTSWHVTYANSTTSLLVADNLLNKTTNIWGQLVFASSEVELLSSFIDQAIIVQATSSNPTDGDSDIDLYITYKIISI